MICVKVLQQKDLCRYDCILKIRKYASIFDHSQIK
jgi:hypothetical protein